MKKYTLFSTYSKKHGILWWLCLGVWWWLVPLTVAIPLLVFRLLFKKKKQYRVKVYGIRGEQPKGTHIQAAKNSEPKKTPKTNNQRWGELNRDIIETSARGESGRNSYLEMYKILKSEKKTTEALKMLLTVLFLDLNGNGNKLLCVRIAQHKQLKMKWTSSFDIDVFVAPYIEKEIVKYIDICDNDIIHDAAKRHSHPDQICSPSEFSDIVHLLLNEKDTSKYVNSVLKKNYTSVLKKHGIKI